MIYLQLFYEFFKIGLFAIGGGMATIPFLAALADKSGWFTQAQLIDMIAVSESTPGPIGLNMATYVGYITAGLFGGVVATIGLIVPSLIIVLLIAHFLKTFKDNKYVEAAFYGLRPASTGLIASAGCSVILISLFNVELYKATGQLLDLFLIKGIILAVILYISTNFVKPLKKLHPIMFIALSAAAGIIFQFAGLPNV